MKLYVDVIILKNKDVFLKSADKYLINCNYNEYFMSGVYNVMIENNKKIKSMKTDFIYHLEFQKSISLLRSQTNIRSFYNGSKNFFTIDLFYDNGAYL